MANVHLDATEHEDHVVFMHNIQDGPANRSFGLQVAKLAGIPSDVLDQARQKLSQLESDQGGPVTVPPAQVNTPAQNDLFSAAQPHPAIEALREASVDDMSPRDALEFLYDLKNKL